MRALGFFGDLYHEAQPQRDLFLRSGGPGLTWTQGRVTTFDWSTLGDYGLVVLAVEDRQDKASTSGGWMTDDHVGTIRAWVEAGGTLVGFHSGLASYPEDGPFVALVGGCFQFHPRQHPIYRFTPEPGNHPLTRGVEPFEVEDELYFVRRPAGASRLLATAGHPDYGTSAALWCADRGRGRVVGFTPGHNPATLAHPGLEALVRNLLAWAQAPEGRP